MSWTKKAVGLGTLWTLILAGSVLASGRPARAAQEAQKVQPAVKTSAPVEAPFAEKELIKLIKHNKRHPEKVATEVQTRGTEFEFTPDIVKKLTKAGASEKLVTYMKQFTPSARAARKSGVQAGSPEELAAFNALMAVYKKNDPDGIIKAADDFSAKYPKSPLLTYVYTYEASAYRQKDDGANVVKYGEKSLDLNPDNLMSLLMVSIVLPQPQMLRNVSDAERAKRLATAEGYAEKVLKGLDQVPKQSGESADAYQKRKDQIAADAYSSLGMVHFERSTMALEGLDQDELAKAETNFKAALGKSSKPNPGDYYRLGEVYKGENKIDDAITAFSKAGQLAAGFPSLAIIQQLANQQIQELKQAKSSQPKAAAKP